MLSSLEQKLSHRHKPTVTMSQRSRHYAFTINASETHNYNGWAGTWDTNIQSKVDQGIIKYCVYGRETGETGTKHLQGHVYFRNLVSLAVAKRHLGCTHAHLEIARNPAASIKYAKKGCTRSEESLREAGLQATVEFGSAPSQGERKDLKEKLKPLLDGSISRTEFIESHPDVFCRYRQGVNAIADIAAESSIPEIRDMEVELWYGEAGTGKTWKARMENKNAYEPLDFNDKKVWFDGYHSQTCLILDEFASEDGARLNCNSLKRYLDRFPLRVPIKGGSARAAWTKVIIISNTTPFNWYRAGADRTAFFDRVSKVRQFIPNGVGGSRLTRYQSTTELVSTLVRDQQGCWSFEREQAAQPAQDNINA